MSDRNSLSRTPRSSVVAPRNPGTSDATVRGSRTPRSDAGLGGTRFSDRISQGTSQGLTRTPRTSGQTRTPGLDRTGSFGQTRSPSSIGKAPSGAGGLSRGDLLGGRSGATRGDALGRRAGGGTRGPGSTRLGDGIGRGGSDRRWNGDGGRYYGRHASGRFDRGKYYSGKHGYAGRHGHYSRYFGRGYYGRYCGPRYNWYRHNYWYGHYFYPYCWYRPFAFYSYYQPYAYFVESYPVYEPAYIGYSPSYVETRTYVTEPASESVVTEERNYTDPEYEGQATYIPARPNGEGAPSQSALPSQQPVEQQFIGPPSPAPQTAREPAPDPALAPAEQAPPAGAQPQDEEAPPPRPAQPTAADLAAVAESLRAGDHAMAGGRYEAALQEYQKALTRNPEDHRTLLSCGLSELAQGRYDRAAAALHEAQALEPGLATSNFNIREKISRAEDLAAQIATLQRRHEADPRDADTLLVLAFTRYFTDSKPEGKTLFKSYLALRADDQPVVEFVNRIP